LNIVRLKFHSSKRQQASRHGVVWQKGCKLLTTQSR
jgi:hypothetical protein